MKEMLMSKKEVIAVVAVGAILTGAVCVGVKKIRKGKKAEVTTPEEEYFEEDVVINAEE